MWPSFRAFLPRRFGANSQNDKKNITCVSPQVKMPSLPFPGILLAPTDFKGSSLGPPPSIHLGRSPVQTAWSGGGGVRWSTVSSFSKRMGWLLAAKVRTTVSSVRSLTHVPPSASFLRRVSGEDEGGGGGREGRQGSAKKTSK